MSNLQETPRFRPADRKRRTTTGEDRVPTPHPLLDQGLPVFSNKYVNPGAITSTPKKASMNFGKSGLIAVKQNSSPPNAAPSSSSEPMESQNEELDVDPLEILKGNINKLFDRTIANMIEQYEEYRTRIMNEVDLVLGGKVEVRMETFEDEGESQTVEEMNEESGSEMGAEEYENSAEEEADKENNFLTK